jgi:methyl-accepting chemotaxis protein
MSIYSLLDRLLLWQKFVILSAIALVLTGIPTYLYVHEADKANNALTLELQGLAPAAAALKVVQLTQQHRGLSALVLGGVTQAQDKRNAKQREVDQAYDAMSAIIKSLNDKDIDAAWMSVQQDWTSLRTQVSNHGISVAQSYAAHTVLVPKLLSVTDLVADYYGLSLDPDLDTYQLIQSMYYHLPYLTEEVGKMRAKGAGLLAQKTATLEDRMVLSGIITGVNTRLNQTITAFKKAAVANPQIQLELADNVHEMVKLAGNTVQLATDKIIKAENPDYSAVDYVGATTQAIDAQFKVNILASKMLERLLTEKLSNAHQREWMVLGTLFGLIALAGITLYFIALSILRPMNYAVKIARMVASGDLTSDIEVRAVNETGQLLQSLRDMNNNLVRIVGAVRTDTDIIAAASIEIAAGNNDLSLRTEQGASSLEETAAAMEQLAGTVKQNADNARQANQLAVSASTVALEGGDVVSQVVATMDLINASSRKIVDIISVIDGIAFQTNILALNAAVEAARAGEQGRGFAVVASEVRSLAQRSAAAAKEINILISDSVDKVGTGSKLVEQAGATMDEVVASVKRVTAIVGEISSASQEQSTGIEQVNQAITQMDDVTQQNAALVEEAAAASQALQNQTANLAQVVSVFKLTNNHQLTHDRMISG